MTGKTHILGGVAASTCLMALGFEQSIVTVSAAMFGSLLPDIDHFNSKIANENGITKLVAAVTTTIFKHRGILHTPMFVFLVAAVLIFIYQYRYAWLAEIILPLLAGMLSHLLLDTLNPGGIMWLWPISKKKYYLASIATGSIMEYAVIILLVGLILMGITEQISPQIVKTLLGV